MFRIVSIIAFLITFVGIALHYTAFRPKLDDLFGLERRLRFLDGLRMLVFLLTLLLLKQRSGFLSILRKLVYLLALLCFVVLAVTGLYPVLVRGQHLSGYLLMIHATFAPVFAACLTVLALMWAHRCRFSESDCPLWFQRIIRRETVNKDSFAEKSCLGQKICFWLIILLALPVILSIVLSMFPLFGTDGQEFLLNLHRYSTLLLALAVIVHTYLIIRTQMEE